MSFFSQECPEVNLGRRMAKLWYRWVETKGLEYPRGVQGTWTRIQELVTLMPGVEEVNPDYIATPLASPQPSPPGTVLAPRPLSMVTPMSSEGSNSVTGPFYREDEE